VRRKSSALTGQLEELRRLIETQHEAVMADASGLFRGMRIAFLPSLGLWALIIWLAWSFWPL
jgi:hypothetical protein